MGKITEHEIIMFVRYDGNNYYPQKWDETNAGMVDDFEYEIVEVPQPDSPKLDGDRFIARCRKKKE